MNTCLSIKNSSNIPVSVYIDDEPFSFLLPKQKSICKSISSGSTWLKVLDGHEKIVFDLWLSVIPQSRHLLEIFDTDYTFKSFPHS